MAVGAFMSCLILSQLVHSLDKWKLNIPFIWKISFVWNIPKHLFWSTNYKLKRHYCAGKVLSTASKSVRLVSIWSYVQCVFLRSCH